MLRFLLAILLVLSTCAVVVHGVLVYQLTVKEFVIAEEETSDDKPQAKQAKEISKETMGFSLYLYHRTVTEKSYKSALNRTFYYPTGFYNQPYNPPDLG